MKKEWKSYKQFAKTQIIEANEIFRCYLIFFSIQMLFEPIKVK